ncbi:hypothetical protein K3495_g9597 [Podosphaera aphanis]|nr:hypothetical protein K3495_g9597 [Podosphaera aphanis]
MSLRVDARTKKKTEENKENPKVTVDSGYLKVGNNRELWKPLPKQSDFNLDPRSLFLSVNPENKAFHFSAMLRGNISGRSMFRAQHDLSGIDNAMAFPRVTLSGGKDNSGLYVFTADGGATELKEFTCFNIEVSEIWRRAYAFIRPQDKKRDPLILIGDEIIDGKQVSLNSPEFAPSSPHNLVLQPEGPVAYKSEGDKKLLAAETKNSQADDEPSETSEEKDNPASEADDSETDSLK